VPRGLSAGHAQQIVEVAVDPVADCAAHF